MRNSTPCRGSLRVLIREKTGVLAQTRSRRDTAVLMEPLESRRASTCPFERLFSCFPLHNKRPPLVAYNFVYEIVLVVHTNVKNVADL